MNRTELINSLSEETTFGKRDVTRVLDALVRIMGRELKKGNRLQWSGLGTFLVAKRPARVGINPITKQRINLPETRVPRFKPGKQFKELIKSAR
jgi:DNA-binding protein HU-beta